MTKQAGGKSTYVEFLRNKDKRKNIPTEELRGFAAEDESTFKAMLHLCDPSLDLRLTWRGADEQDLLIEVTGEKKKDEAAKVATARTL